MIPFSFDPRTKIEYGAGKASRAGEFIKPYGIDKILVVYGEKSAKESGLLDNVTKSLTDNGIEVSLFSSIRPNPEVKSVMLGVKQIKEERIAGILALGGGSVMDASKAMAVATYYDGDPMDFSLGLATPTKALPLFCIPTLAASGSEGSNSCVISDDFRNLKKGFHSDLVRPPLSIIDPETTLGVPPRVMAGGAIDMLMHSIERFMADSYPYQLSDDWALALMRQGKKALDAAMKDPNDMEARGALSLFAYLSHNGLTSLGKDGTFLVHPIQQALGGSYPKMSHPEGVGVIFLGYWRYRQKEEKEKFARLTNALFDVSIENEEACSIIGVSKYASYLEELGLPTSLEQLGVKETDIEKAAELATAQGTRAIGLGSRSLEKADIISICRLCYKTEVVL